VCSSDLLTGGRIPKDKEYKMFHDPITGRNIKVGKDREAPKGGTLVNITDSYELYLQGFKNTSQADLKKYNQRLLLEEAGFEMENQQKGDYYVGDKNMSSLLKEQGYKVDSKGVFKDVPLGVLTKLSHIPGTSDFWSPDLFMSKGEIIPQSFENTPYTNEQEFVDFLVERRKQNNDITSKKAALWQTWYLNRDPETISKNRLGQIGGAFMQAMFGEDITIEQSSKDFAIPIPLTNQKKIDIIASQIVPDSGVDVSKQQEAYFERRFSDEVWEAGGGLAAMLLTLSLVNKASHVLGINKPFGGVYSQI